MLFLLLISVSVKVKLLSHVRLFETPWTTAYQVPPSVGFSRQEYWSGLPFPSPGDLPNPGIEPRSPTLQAYVLPSEPPGKSISLYMPLVIHGVCAFCHSECYSSTFGPNKPISSSNTSLKKQKSVPRLEDKLAGLLRNGSVLYITRDRKLSQS